MSHGLSRSALVVLAIAAVAAVSTAPAHAAPTSILVLPLDGDAPREARAQYSQSVQRLARVLGGKLASGDATFTDTATAIGCDPKLPACAEDVRATLGVDELIYGTLTRRGAQLVLVVRRTAKGAVRREVTATVAAADPPERAEASLLPLFHREELPPPSTEPAVAAPAEVAAAAAAPPRADTVEPVVRARPRSHRTLGIVAIAGGGAAIAGGVALWVSSSRLGDQIASHPISTFQDFVELQELEDRASSRARLGNVAVGVGLVAAGLGTWLVLREAGRPRAVIAPAPQPGGGAALTFTWLGGLP